MSDSLNDTLVWKLSTSSIVMSVEGDYNLVSEDTLPIHTIYHVMLMSYLGLVTVFSVVLNSLFIYLTTKYHQFHEPYMYIRIAYAIIDIILPLVCLVQYSVNFYVQEIPSWLTCSVGYVILGLFYNTL